jgi:succinyl-diaminopimelate desuccinylase
VAKGALRLRLDLHGAMAHGAMPFQGRNPNRAAGLVLVALAELEGRLQERHREHPYLGKVWVTPTVLRAGEPGQMNVIPATASVWVDVRTVPGVDHDSLVSDLTALVDTVGAPLGIRIAVDRIDDRPTVDVDVDDRLVRAVWDAHVAVGTTPPRLGGVPGSTDGTILTSRTGVPSVVYGPGGKWIAHQVNEFVEIADIVDHARVYVEAARRFLGAT